MSSFDFPLSSLLTALHFTEVLFILSVFLHVVFSCLHSLKSAEIILLCSSGSCRVLAARMMYYVRVNKCKCAFDLVARNATSAFSAAYLDARRGKSSLEQLPELLNRYKCLSVDGVWWEM